MAGDTAPSCGYSGQRNLGRGPRRARLRIGKDLYVLWGISLVSRSVHGWPCSYNSKGNSLVGSFLAGTPWSALNSEKAESKAPSLSWWGSGFVSERGAHVAKEILFLQGYMGP